MHILESTLRLFFDVLHGIKRIDVPLIMVVEFIVLLGYDGQLEQSDMEKELFTSAITQLKERFNSLVTIILSEVDYFNCLIIRIRNFLLKILIFESNIRKQI